MATLAAAIVLPLVRKRLRVPNPVTLAVSAAGPLAVTVLSPRTRKRDVALFAMQMWAFTVVHEMPYDDPEKLRRRLYTRYPITVDRAIGLALDAGINYFDTAVQYGNGVSETNLGRILGARKPAGVAVGTKVRVPSELCAGVKPGGTAAAMTRPHVVGE